MYKYIILLLTLFTIQYGQADGFSYPIVSRMGVTIRDFVPSGWDTTMTVKDDLNKDSVPDIVSALVSFVVWLPSNDAASPVLLNV